MSDFNTTMQALMDGMDKHISSKTVVGEPIQADGATIIPLIDVSFGVGAGAFSNQETSSGKANRAKDTTGGGLGGKMSPNALLVIKNGEIKLVNIKQQDGLTKILDTVPDLIDKFKKTEPKEAE